MKKFIFALVIFLFFGTTALGNDIFELCRYGTPEEVQSAIKAGADVNARDGDRETVLMVAVRNSQHVEVISALLAAGADVNAVDDFGRTALKWLKWSEIDIGEILPVLLKAGAGVNIRDVQERTPLMWAAGGVKADLITALIAAGANVNDKDDEGTTALMFAVREWEYPSDVIPALIEAGADINAKNSEGKRAIDYFEENERLQMSDEEQEGKIKELLKGKS